MLAQELYEGKKVSHKRIVVREECAALFDNRKEMRDKIFFEDDRLAEVRPAFGAADIKRVAKCSKIFKGDIIFRTRQSISKPRAVDVEPQIFFKACSSSRV